MLGVSKNCQQRRGFNGDEGTTAKNLGRRRRKAFRASTATKETAAKGGGRRSGASTATNGDRKFQELQRTSAEGPPGLQRRRRATAMSWSFNSISSRPSVRKGRPRRRAWGSTEDFPRRHMRPVK
ncbi:hypothetical protein ACP70R_038039 [Stipagrostis hirtigluma subsp. patula]